MKNYLEYAIAYICGLAFCGTIGILGYMAHVPEIWVAGFFAIMALTFLMVIVEHNYYLSEEEDEEYYN